MLFNSYEFILLFLPITLGLFWLMAKSGNITCLLGLLSIASLFFYGWWYPSYLALIGISILVNYLLGNYLQNTATGKHWKQLLLYTGIIVNLGFLGYYKYGGFLVEIFNDISNGNVKWVTVALPLAISFFTFQQITYLIDSSAGKVKKSTFLEYVVFVTFFPQLIAGPIVHHKEMMPQFASIFTGINRRNLQVGITLFTIGLFKKAVLADSIAEYVSPIYNEASLNTITFLQAWIAGVGFTLQIYFDFSGYSDMALGAARMFGIILPINFNSPLKAHNIIDFWSRWHITLTRLLTDYIYTPLSIYATRNMTLHSFKHRSLRKIYEFVYILTIPTLITMFASGIWHGSGYKFAIFGLLHGSYLVINHLWRQLLPRSISKNTWYRFYFKPVGLLLTLMSVSIGMFFFRSDSALTASNMVTSMLGINGVSIPEGIFVHLGSLKTIILDLGISIDTTAGSAITYGILYCLALLGISLFMPNSLDIMKKCDPALGFSESSNDMFNFRFISDNLVWLPTRKWAVFTGILLAIGVLSLQEISVFLYWQF